MTRLATTPAILGIFVGGMAMAGVLAGCGSNKVEIGSQHVDAQAPGSDAAAGRGGAAAGGSGGGATGGATGGVTGTGGIASTGGTLAAGGVARGGTVGAGGATLSGGITGVGSGGSGGSGGSKVTASGGTTASGGSKASGGTIGTGGTNASGGVTGTSTGCAPGWTLCCGQCLSPMAGVCMTPCPAAGGAGPAGGSPSTGGTTHAGGSTGAGGTAGAGGTGGSTGTKCGGIAGLLCAAGEICDMQPGTCNFADQGGTCVVQPRSCPVVAIAPQPVCGCDGRTYYDDCYRQVAGVSKNFDGACPTTDAGADGSTGKTCGGFAGVSCPTNEFCDISVGLCNSPDAAGTCVVNTGVMCPMVVLPVCGCDGRTYSSDCVRQSAGVSKKSDGACATADAGLLMTPTLPAACQIDGDCCVAMDTCTAMAYLVGRTEYAAMVASIPDINSRVGTCVACIQPAVQVQCKGGFCAGEKLPYTSSSGPLMASHCGYINVSDAGAPTSSAHAAGDAGAAAGPSTWSCSSP